MTTSSELSQDHGPAMEGHSLTETCGETTLYGRQISAADGVAPALWRCGHDHSETLSRPPVVLIPGTYSNRRFWLSRSGKGLAPFLYQAGYDVWLLELRGHGDADGGPGRRHPGYRHWSIEDIVRYDLAAAADAVQRANPGKVCWMGHSFGGIYVTAALSLGTLPNDQVAGVITCGSQYEEGQAYLANPVLNWTLRNSLSLLGRFPARRLGMGSEDEPPGVINEALLWKRQKRWVSPAGIDYAQNLSRIRVPVLAMGGCGDTVDPVSGCEAFFQRIGTSSGEFLKLGREYGYQKDYGHVDMLIGETAEQEVWPMVLRWMQSLSN